MRRRPEEEGDRYRRRTKGSDMFSKNVPLILYNFVYCMYRVFLLGGGDIFGIVNRCVQNRWYANDLSKGVWGHAPPPPQKMFENSYPTLVFKITVN